MSHALLDSKRQNVVIGEHVVLNSPFCLSSVHLRPEAVSRSHSATMFRSLAQRTAYIQLHEPSHQGL